MRRRASHHIIDRWREEVEVQLEEEPTARSKTHLPASAGGRFDFDPHGLPWRLTELDLSFEFFEIRAVFVVEGEG